MLLSVLLEQVKVFLLLFRKTSPQIIVQGGAYRERLGNDVTEEKFMGIIKDSAKKGYNILTVSFITI